MRDYGHTHTHTQQMWSRHKDQSQDEFQIISERMIQSAVHAHCSICLPLSHTLATPLTFYNTYYHTHYDTHYSLACVDLP